MNNHKLKAVVWVVHAIICVLFIWGTINYMNTDDNRTETDVPLTVIKIIQEDHKSSTSYRGVFQMENGRYIDFNVSASTFATTKPGDQVLYKLNKYETKEAEHEFPILGFLFFIGTVCYVMFGTTIVYYLKIEVLE